VREKQLGLRAGPLAKPDAVGYTFPQNATFDNTFLVLFGTAKLSKETKKLHSPVPAVDANITPHRIGREHNALRPQLKRARFGF
jgi:hypothetical protein